MVCRRHSPAWGRQCSSTTARSGAERGRLGSDPGAVARRAQPGSSGSCSARQMDSGDSRVRGRRGVHRGAEQRRSPPRLSRRRVGGSEPGPRAREASGEARAAHRVGTRRRHRALAEQRRLPPRWSRRGNGGSEPDHGPERRSGKASFVERGRDEIAATVVVGGSEPGPRAQVAIGEARAVHRVETWQRHRALVERRRPLQRWSGRGNEGSKPGPRAREAEQRGVLRGAGQRRSPPRWSRRSRGLGHPSRAHGPERRGGEAQAARRVEPRRRRGGAASRGAELVRPPPRWSRGGIGGTEPGPQARGAKRRGVPRGAERRQPPPRWSRRGIGGPGRAHGPERRAARREPRTG